MRPSELGGITETPPTRKLKFPVDETADPPISIEEALAATGALCTRHGGMIGQRGEKPGMVFLCTGCGERGMYWRYARDRKLNVRPLAYRSRGYL